MMMMTVKRWVASNFGSSSWLLLAPAAAPLVATWMRAVPAAQMYFDLHLRHRVRRMLPFLDPFVTIDISSSKPAGAYSLDENIKSSDAYEEVKAYLSAACGRDARELRADGAAEGDGFVLSLREGQEVADEFRGAAMWWSSVPPGGKRGQGGGGRHCLRLTFDQRHRQLVVDEYLPHVRHSGRDVMFRNRRRRLYTNKKSIDYSSKVWRYIDFDHPTTFDTLAMHPAKKRKIMDDLNDFRNNRDYYRRIGNAWKRGYLLYGPPGTGKSTMIAAMANYLDYDIYNIELTMVHSNNDLRKLFIETTGKSIIVIEDIDCSLDLTVTGDRRSSLPATAAAAALAAAKRKRISEVTLSGLLNFIDGLWSAHSGERLIVFTTNFVDKLDPALIRRGRMDVHVEMSYCCFEAFTTLAMNYLGVDAHPLFDAVRELLQVVEITPADVAECLMVSKRADRGADACLARLVDELKKKAAEKEAKKNSQEEEEEVAAPPADSTKPNDTSTNGRRVIDAKSIRRVKKAAKKEEEGGDGTAATAKPKANGREAMANGETESCVGVGANDDPNDDDDSSSDNHGDVEKDEADAETNNGIEAMATDDGGRGTVSVAGAGGGTVFADDYGDDIDEDCSDDDFNDMDYDDDDSDSDDDDEDGSSDD